MFFFAQRGFDVVDQIPAVALAFAGDTLDVFWVDAEADRSGFHNAVVLCSKDYKTARMFFGRRTVVRKHFWFKGQECGSADRTIPS